MAVVIRLDRPGMRQVFAGYGKFSGEPPLPRTGEGWGEGNLIKRDEELSANREVPSPKLPGAGEGSGLP